MPLYREQVVLDGQSPSLDDASCGGAVCTLARCTIADPPTALAQARCVPRPGGRLHLLEHGLAPDPKVAAYQHRVEPLQRRVADGCHLTRDPLALVTGAGFAGGDVGDVGDVERIYGAGPRPRSYLTRTATVRT